MDRAPRPFLTAEWRHLAMLNYEIEAAALAPFVPRGTELDLWRGRAFISLVGFLFRKTRLRGLIIPFHSDFKEVNLRFYVRREMGNEIRRAVVFIKEIVPRRAIAWAARAFYNENYVAMPMRHGIVHDAAGACREVRYTWGTGRRPNFLELSVSGPPAEAVAGSEAEFITEHYWGYARQRDGGTVEYEVRHPRWRLWAADRASLRCDAEKIYGPGLAPCLQAPPASAFLAEGSAVTVFRGRRIA